MALLLWGAPMRNYKVLLFSRRRLHPKYKQNRESCQEKMTLGMVNLNETICLFRGLLSNCIF